VLHAVVLTQYRRVTDGQTDGQTDRQTDEALRRALKTYQSDVIAKMLVFTFYSAQQCSHCKRCT